MAADVDEPQIGTPNSKVPPGTKEGVSSFYMRIEMKAGQADVSRNAIGANEVKRATQTL